MTPTVSSTFHKQHAAADRRDCRHTQLALQPRFGKALPQELSSFVGNGAQIAAVEERLRSARLVTLTGPGGVGKTRLALQVARRAQSAYTNCVWIGLGSLEDASRIGEMIAAALGARSNEPSSAPLETPVDCIRGDALLLVIDNCEHLIDRCAEVLFRVLRECGGVRVIATSREPLSLPGEVVYPVEPLSVPKADEPLDEQIQSESVRLFLERAWAREPRLQLHDHNRQCAADICRSLNGMPLAIELAAARTGSMTLVELAARLDDPLGVLTVGPRAAPVRQQTLRASLDWSHRLLQPPEQELLMRLANLAGEFTLEDAEAAFAGAEVQLVVDVALVLDRLVSQSMVQAREHGGTMRFSLPTAVRDYGLERSGAAVKSAGESVAFRPVPIGNGTPDDVQVAVDECKSEHPPVAAAKRQGRRPTTLSERERAVVLLIADGRSNRQIAEDLVITKKTAEAHVSHILTKLGLCSRVQIATWSIQHGVHPGAEVGMLNTGSEAA